MVKFRGIRFLKLKGTVIFRIWWQVLLMGLYSAGVVYVYRYYYFSDQPDTPKNLNIFQVLAIVTGLLLVFRTNTAYDRYWEGRKLWSEMVNNIRIITRTIWTMMDDKHDAKILIGKVSVLNLLVAFAYATKHYLREEYSPEEEDLTDFIKHLPKLQTPSSNQPLEDQEKNSMDPNHQVLRQIRRNMSKDTRLFTAEANTNDTPDVRRKERIRLASLPEFERTLPQVNSNIPLEISFFVSSYIMSNKDLGLLDSPTCRILDTAVGNMIRCLTGFERIRRTPIPFAYSVHLQQITWLVLMLLPIQWVYELNWYAVPATVFASFSLLGILEIGDEIENPFGYDLNDLNLDDFCKVVHKEVMALIAQPMKTPEVWLYSDINHPIITDLSLSAVALAKMKYEEVQLILSHGKDYKFFHPSKSGSVKSTRSEASQERNKPNNNKVQAEGKV